MEQTQENKTAEKKEISYPKFIQEKLDRIPWEELEASYGIRKDYILGNEQVTDYVRCYTNAVLPLPCVCQIIPLLTP